MKREHCEICNRELGKLPPFFVGDETQWNVLEGQNINKAYCTGHHKEVEGEVNKVFVKLRKKYTE